MPTRSSDPPAVSSAPHTWRSLMVGLGLFCLVAGLFLAAGFKESLVPKVVAISGIALLVVGGVASAITSRRPAGSGN